MALNFTTSNPPADSKRSDADEGWVLALVILLYGAIAVVGVFGNVFVFKVILSARRRKVSEYLILNLCATDLGACAVSIPLDLVERTWKRFPFGEFLCNVMYPFQTILLGVSVVTLLAMSYERYRLIVTPFKRRINSKIAICTIIVIWIVTSLLVLPYMMILHFEDEQCIERWPLEIHRKAFTVSVFLVLYLIPLLIITVSYTLIIRNLYQDSKKQMNEWFELEGNRSEHLRKMAINRVQRNMRVVKVFMSAGVVFALCMLPTHICWLWHDLGSGSTNRHFSNLITFSNVLIYLNSAIDPFIFGSFKIRKLCLDVSSCKVRRRDTRRRGSLVRLRTKSKLNFDEMLEREIVHDRVTSL